MEAILQPAIRWARAANVRVGSFTSFPPSRLVRFAPKSGHSADACVYECENASHRVYSKR
jgi:hypothetical protein